MTDEDEYPFPGPNPDGTLSEEDEDVIQETPTVAASFATTKTATSAITTKIRWGVSNPSTTPNKARLYADVQTVIGGFREEKTGERGVPASVAREDVLMACYAAQPTMSI